MAIGPDICPNRKRFFGVLAAVAFGIFFLAVTSFAADAKTEIASLLDHQVDDWNRGDLPHFVSHYAATATIVGKAIQTRSREQILTHYKSSYGGPGAMGKLAFAHLAVQPLDSQVAIATANWHVERSASAGGPVGGVFSIVLRRESSGWQIVLDHTN